MFIDPSLLKSTAFLVENGEEVGTVFFVSVPLGNTQANTFGEAFYAVTAGHCIAENGATIKWPTAAHKDDTDTLETDWITNDEVDLAICPLTFDPRSCGIVPLPYRTSVEDSQYLILYEDEGETKSALPYGEGDEVFTTGLFRTEYGLRVSQPVARFGHIALRPGRDEKVFIKNRHGVKKGVDALLVEMAIWKGQSGSPIFTRPWKDESKRFDLELPGEITLVLGVAQGFYPGRQDVRLDHQKKTISGLGMGIGVVIPFGYVVEILSSPKLKALRDEQLRNETLARQHL